MSNPPLRCVVSVSGFRGVVGETIDPATVLALAAAYGEVIARGKPVVLGRDSRPTGGLLADAARAGLRAVGCEVIDIGVVPTPTVPIMIRELRARGGIQISASHNPVEWNALKFFTGKGRNIDGKQLQRLLAAYESAAGWQRWDGVGAARCVSDALEVHRRKVVECVDREAIANAGLTVLVDSVNGAGSRIAPALLDDLGVRAIPIYNDPNRLFPRDPEPTADNVTETGSLVKAAGAAVGFIQDPDADRLAIIDERGRYIGEEYTLVLCAYARLAAAKRDGIETPIACTNLSTSRMLDDVAERIGAKVVRTAVGEANVVDGMQAHDAVIGGEGNGGVIEPRVVWGRDSQAGIALVLELLATSGKSVSELVDELPSYAIHKEKVALDRDGVSESETVLMTGEIAAGAQIDRTDGIKLSWPDRWVHLRASGTEPVSRIITEAPTAREARGLAKQVRQAVGTTVITGH